MCSETEDIFFSATLYAPCTSPIKEREISNIDIFVILSEELVPTIPTKNRAITKARDKNFNVLFLVIFSILNKCFAPIPIKIDTIHTIIVVYSFLFPHQLK